MVNTCAVTAEAVRQARQSIRRLKRERPDAKIVVTGCAAQTEPQTFADMPEVALVVGNEQKMQRGVLGRAARCSREHRSGSSAEEKSVVNDIMAVRETALHLVEGIEGHARAFVQVQNGCDHRCTFCIIPFGRGNSRSVPMGEVVGAGAPARRERLPRGGAHRRRHHELRRRTCPARRGSASWCGRSCKHVPELERLRISSIDSVEADADLLDALADEPRLMPHLHLSLQHGDDLILKRMKRRHSRADAIASRDQVRRLRPDIVFGADIIAGFPTETEAAFARSRDLVDECGLTHLHVFPYSARPGTPAARMPQVPHPLRKERARAAAPGRRGRAAPPSRGGSRRAPPRADGIRTTSAAPSSSRRCASRRRPSPGRCVDLTIAGHDGRQPDAPR